eukprot:CAMPEP_0172497172 /NCGR_PEP_ID=MMETSP1066-20121228/96238_1 /TAXON_ID=671091 /ORGANISM="Coscinodiscus wailesii, Strain CCMP2513" /LENGTH=49 /DNA_ID= /DNA_START= /DNA_END= /DNA_ORIENTATION=
MPKKENGYDLGWKGYFDQLCRYKEDNGHCLVPTKCEENPQLSNWVKRQR